MARIRTVKPEFWTSEQVAECSPNARLLFIGLWNFCDDGGRHPDSAMRIKMEVFPADNMTADDVELLLGQLIDSGLLVRYEAQGKDWLQVTGWHHQRIDRPQFRYPAPNGQQLIVEHSTNAPPRSRREGNGYIRSIKSDHVCGLSEAETEQAAARMAKAAKRIGKPPTNAKDLELLAKAAALSLRTPYSEAWFFDAAEGVARSTGTKRKPYAYFRTCLKNAADRIGVELNLDLRHTKIPQVLLRPPPTETAERLCAPVE
jgi:hypothetical protein